MQMPFRQRGSSAGSGGSTGSANGNGSGSSSGIGFFRSLFSSRHGPRDSAAIAPVESTENLGGDEEHKEGSTIAMEPASTTSSGEYFDGEEQNGKRSSSLLRLKDNWSETDIFSWTPNEYEKELVKLTWSDDFNFLYELGTAIYIYIFEHNPQAKVLFPKIHQHGENWKTSADFRSQALKFVQTISFATKSLYHMEECLQPRLYEIGQHHVKYASRGFKPEYWNIFLDAMENALTEHIHAITDFTSQQCNDATQVWRQLAHYIIVHMKRGYQDEEDAMARENGHKSNDEKKHSFL